MIVFFEGTSAKKMAQSALACQRSGTMPCESFLWEQLAENGKFPADLGTCKKRRENDQEVGGLHVLVYSGARINGESKTRSNERLEVNKQLGDYDAD